MPHPLDMIGTVRLDRRHVAPVDLVNRLAEALRAETVDVVTVREDHIEIRIDGRKKFRPGGDGWLFLLWAEGTLRVTEDAGTVSATFRLRTSAELPMFILAIEAVALLGWFTDPVITVLLSVFVGIVISSIMWTRYVRLPRWLRRVLTDLTTPKPRRIKERGDGA